MSIPADSASWPGDVMDLQVLCLSGEGVTLTIPASMAGKDLHRMVSEQLPFKPGAKIYLHHMETSLKLHQSLQQQGISMSSATLSCTYMPTDLLAAWRFVNGEKTEEMWTVLEGITQIADATEVLNFSEDSYLYYLPKHLDGLTLGRGYYDIGIPGLLLPSSLKHLTLAEQFNQSLDLITLPTSLQSLTLVGMFNQSLENVTLPNSLQSLTLGGMFNQSLDDTTLPICLKSLVFGDWFNQSLEGVTFPTTLEHLTFGRDFDQSLEGVSLPTGLQSLSFGDYFDQSLDSV